MMKKRVRFSIGNKNVTFFMRLFGYNIAYEV